MSSSTPKLQLHPRELIILRAALHDARYFYLASAESISWLKCGIAKLLAEYERNQIPATEPPTDTIEEH